MLKKLLYLFIGLLFSASITQAQISSYLFSASTGGAAAFQQVSAATLTIVPNCGYTAQQGDEGYANNVPIGFTFKYLGTNYTTLNVATNGFLTFGASGFASGANCTYDNTTGLSLTPAATVSANRPILAPLWDDLDASGGIQVITTGIAPLRVFTVQWLNAKWDWSGTSALSFQVKLYETSNIIEFVYRQEAGAVSNTSGGASIGICATATGANNFQSLGSTGTAPVVSLATETQNLSTKPATGQIYRWDPVYCTAGSTSTSFEKISNVSLNTINNASTSTAQYENFTTVSTSLQPSSSYPITVSIGGGFSSDQVIVFIDYNQNGVFTDAGETVYTSAQGVGPHTGNFTVPAAATLGLTRMRVRMHDASLTPNATSCGTSSFGQVEDYTINIQTCAASTGTIAPATQTVCTGAASITATAAGTGITYQWQVSTNGGATWADLTNAAPYSGVTTSVLAISAVTGAMNNNQYRVTLGGTCTPAGTVTNTSILKTLAVAPTIAPAAPTVCLGTTQNWVVTAPATFGTPVVATFTQTNTPPLGCTSPCVSNSPITVSGIPAGVTISQIRVTMNMTHTWISDMIVNLKAPNGSVLNLFNQDGGSGDNFVNTIVSSAGGTAFTAGAPPYTGTFAPKAASGVGPAGSVSNVTTFSGLYSVPNGAWTLVLQDLWSGDDPFLNNWTVEITYVPTVPQPVIFTPNTNLYTDAAATVAYTGTAVSSVYYKPTAAGSFSYSASYTAAPCVSEVKAIPVVVNTPVSITTQPANAAACTVQGTATFTTVAAGTGPLVYQWQVDNGTGFANVANGGGYAGATTATLTLTNIPQSWNGYKYRCNVTGIAPCGALATNGAATLTVNPLPTITLSASPYKKLFPGLVTNVSASSTPAAATHAWFYNGGLISGVTGNTVSGIDVDRMGTYSVRVTDINGCVSTSGTISILDSTTGKVFIYPSPNNGQFQVRYYSVVGNEVPRALTVFDGKGSRVFTQVYSVNKPYAKMDVNLKNIGAGIYWVELADRNGKRLATGRVVVLR